MKYLAVANILYFFSIFFLNHLTVFFFVFLYSQPQLSLNLSVTTFPRERRSSFVHQFYSSLLLVSYFNIFIKCSDSEIQDQIDINEQQLVYKYEQNIGSLSVNPLFQRFTTSKNVATTRNVTLACTKLEAISKAKF